MANEITVFQGNDRTLRITVTETNAAAFNLTGAVIYFEVKVLDTDTAKVIELSSAVAAEILVVAPATGGIFDIFLIPADTSSLLGEYVYDITIVVGGKTYTLVKSKFYVTLPVK